MFHWVEVRAFCHATEEEDRVVAALAVVMPEVPPSRQALEGHFGNPLVVLTARADDARTQRAVWARIVTALGKAEVLRGVEERLDEDAVYHLRLDKQGAYLGRIESATSSDAIAFRAKVAAFPRKKENVLKALEEASEAV